MQITDTIQKLVNGKYYIKKFQCKFGKHDSYNNKANIEARNIVIQELKGKPVYFSNIIEDKSNNEIFCTGTPYTDEECLFPYMFEGQYHSPFFFMVK